jgi:hypothetical protein
MTNRTNPKALAAFLVTVALAATSMPAVACEDATRLMPGEVSRSDHYRAGSQANGPTIPHRPETDPLFPRR